MAPRLLKQVRIEGNFAFVPLTQGYFATIDAADVPLVEGFNWCALVARRADGSVRTVYAVRTDRTGGRSRVVLMHRLIGKTPDGFDTDHRDGNGLDNRKANLRTATETQNSQNARISTRNTSGIRGVSWHKARAKWQAQIMSHSKPTFLGYFDTIKEAADAYTAASGALHIEF